jgi:WD40 repeat protein
MLFNFATMQCERQGKISDNKKPKATHKSTAATSSQFLPNKQARCVTYSAKHGHVAVCSNLGKVSIRDFNDLDKKITSLKEAKEWCEVAAYSPDESMLAVGSHCDNIFVYTVSAEGYKLFCKFSRHSSFITSMDWSLDGSYIRSTDGAHELLFYSLETK